MLPFLYFSAGGSFSMRLTRGSGNLQEFGNMILNANPQETARFPKEYGKGRSWGQPQYSRFRQDQSLRIQ